MMMSKLNNFETTVCVNFKICLKTQFIMQSEIV